MKRFHVHVAVPDLPKSIQFYSTLFGTQPAVVKPDYAKWMLDDPRVNFAISTRPGSRNGINHLGFQVESDADLAEIHGRLEAADASVVEERNVSCCYARSVCTAIRIRGAPRAVSADSSTARSIRPRSSSSR